MYLLGLEGTFIFIEPT